ncbi:NAD(P)/FAD-dependent oxidoreductase [bacterium]|nr:NAD(P)/FAD-dependent oxidoreductase [bacterium]
MYDCVVVGAGPVGSYLSKKLAMNGLSVLMLEEHGEVGKPVHCAGVIGADAFKDYNLSIESVLSTINKVNFISPSFNSFILNKNKELAYVVDRSKFDSVLAGEACKTGAELRLNSKVIDVKEYNDRIDVVLDSGETIGSKFCVLATGSMTSLPYNLGFSRPWYFLKGAQVETNFQVANLDTFEIYVGKNIAGGDFVWVIPIGENKARIGICSRYNAKNYLENFLNKEFIKNRLLSNYKIEIGIVPIGGIEERGSCYKRIVAIGDAAGQVKPTTAGGIVLGFKSADKLALIISKNVQRVKNSCNISNEYYRKIRRSIGIELLVCDLFRKIYSHMQEDEWDKLIEYAIDPRLNLKVNQMAEFDRHSKLILWGLWNSEYRKLLFNNVNFSMLSYVRRLAKLVL